MQSITPFLWFDGRAAEAARFYISVFKDGRTLDEEAGDEPRSSYRFTAGGQTFIAFDGGPHFQFTPAISFFINCETQAEIDDLWAKLTEGGEPGRCGWLTDKFGVSWQIVPLVLSELLGDADDAKAQRTLDAMMQMTKLDIRELEAAHAGG